MKKNLVVIIIAILSSLICLSSCEYTEEQARHEEERKDLPGYSTDFRTFTFRGHDYIWFTSEHWGTTADYVHGGIVHDPDCRKCHGENVEVKDEIEELSEYEKIFGKY